MTDAMHNKNIKKQYIAPAMLSSCASTAIPEAKEPSPTIVINTSAVTNMSFLFCDVFC